MNPYMAAQMQQAHMQRAYMQQAQMQHAQMQHAQMQHAQAAQYHQAQAQAQAQGMRDHHQQRQPHGYVESESADSGYNEPPRRSARSERPDPAEAMRQNFERMNMMSGGRGEHDEEAPRRSRRNDDGYDEPRRSRRRDLSRYNDDNGYDEPPRPNERSSRSQAPRSHGYTSSRGQAYNQALGGYGPPPSRSQGPRGLATPPRPYQIGGGGPRELPMHRRGPTWAPPNRPGQEGSVGQRWVWDRLFGGRR